MLTGFLYHWSSGKVVRPRDLSKPVNTDLIITNDIKDTYRFQFSPVSGAGHFGYIEHVASGLVVLPKISWWSTSNTLDPADGTSLIIQPSRHAGALFGFDEDDNFILHRNGKMWCAEKANPNPVINSLIVLSSKQNDAVKFYFGNEKGKPIPPYPTPDYSGDWNLLRAFITPQADHTYNQTYKIGRSRTETEMSRHAWSVSAGYAKCLFSADANYSGAVEETSSETWSEEKEESYTVNVTGDKSVFVWQYMFTISQFGEEVKFLSSIIGDTNDVNVKPGLHTASVKKCPNN